jgi:hypothetical protein
MVRSVDTLFTAALVLVGVGVTTVGAVRSRRTKTFVDRAHRTFGRYVSVAPQRDSLIESGEGTHMVVEFETEDGRSFQFVTRESVFFARHQVGYDVEVLYDPAYPSQALVNQWRELWGRAVAIAAAGIVLVVIGFFAGFSAFVVG